MKNYSTTFTKYNIIIGSVIIVLMLLPYYILGEQSYITTHDFLDSTIAHIHAILRKNAFFDTSATVPILDGQDRMNVPFSLPLEIKALFFTILPPYWAIVANLTVVKILAFVGMYLLLDTYLVGKKFKAVSFFTSLLFAFVPFYTDYGLSAAGIPLVVYSLASLYYNRNVVANYGLVLFFASYSVLALSGFFVCFCLALMILWLWHKDRRFPARLMIALCLLSAVYLVTNWNMIAAYFLSNGFVSYRTEMKPWSDRTFSDICRVVILDILSGKQYHAGTFQAYLILLAFAVVAFFCGRRDKTVWQYVAVFFALTLFITLGAWLKKYFASFQFDRFYFLYPAFGFAVFGKTLALLAGKRQRILVAILLLAVFFGLRRNNGELMTNYAKLRGVNDGNPLYAQFYDEKLFRTIASDLHIPQDYSIKTVSVGMFPAVAEYCGFWTLDSYTNSYSLDYKHRFREIIAGELEKNEDLKKYFDNWGGRCYVYSADLGRRFSVGKTDHEKINLSIDTGKLAQLGCQYVFSAAEIINWRDLDLRFVKSYSTDNSYWQIYVYAL